MVNKPLIRPYFLGGVALGGGGGGAARISLKICQETMDIYQKPLFRLNQRYYELSILYYACITLFPPKFFGPDHTFQPEQWISIFSSNAPIKVEDTPQLQGLRFVVVRLNRQHSVQNSSRKMSMFNNHHHHHHHHHNNNNNNCVP